MLQSYDGIFDNKKKVLMHTTIEEHLKPYAQ